MELVRAYLISGFIVTPVLKKADIERIVDRKINGDPDDLIAHEEAARIRKERRTVEERYGIGIMSMHHTAMAQPMLSASERTSIEWGSGSFEKEESLNDQINRLRAQEEKARFHLKSMNLTFIFSAFLILMANIAYAFLDPSLPIGFFPLPFLIVSLILKNNASTKHQQALDELSAVRIESPYSEIFF